MCKNFHKCETIIVQKEKVMGKKSTKMRDIDKRNMLMSLKDEAGTMKEQRKENEQK